MMQVTRERLVTWEDPLATAETLRGMSGLDAIRAARDRRVPPPPIARLMNFTIVEAEEGRVVFEGYPGEEHYNPIGVVHGGFGLALFDSAMGCAVHTTLPQGVGYTTTDVQVRFIRGITKDTGPVRCEATAVHVGRSTAIAEAKLYDSERRVLGIGTTACAILRR
ncbi:MAG: PaaI family thioesterase [Candidatus Eremiobacteraeota bacterium]|nr:PaaI family thioesterase [Candidatus Eremiobacteraeota bacterium]